MVCLPDGMLIQRLEIYSAAVFTRFFPLGYHPGAPSYGGAHRDRFNHPQPHVLVKASFNFFLGMHRDWYWCVVCHWLGIGVYHEPHVGTAHHWQRLVLTYIECAGGVVVNQPLLQLAPVALCRRVG